MLLAITAFHGLIRAVRLLRGTTIACMDLRAAGRSDPKCCVRTPDRSLCTPSNLLHQSFRLTIRLIGDEA